MTLAEVTTIVYNKPTPCPPWCDRQHDPVDGHGLIITEKGSDDAVWLDDRNDGRIIVNFWWGNKAGHTGDMTVDQAAERGRALLAAVRAVRPLRPTPAKSRIR